MQKTEEILEEIRQIIVQYRNEVGSRRKPWPVSIRKRINKLRALCMNYKKISAASGIPYGSMMNWTGATRKKESQTFHAVAVSETALGMRSETRTVTVPVLSKAENLDSSAVRVGTPDGYQITVTSLSQAMDLLRGLRGESCF